jgi:hypothetical protein
MTLLNDTLHQHVTNLFFDLILQLWRVPVRLNCEWSSSISQRNGVIAIMTRRQPLGILKEGSKLPQ